MMNRALVLSMALAALEPVGCGRDRGSVDLSDPEAVARAFFTAVREHDAEGAASYVLAEQKIGCMEIVRDSDAPRIPGSFDLSVSISGDSGSALVIGTQTGVDLVRIYGRWWVRI